MCYLCIQDENWCVDCSCVVNGKRCGALITKDTKSIVTLFPSKGERYSCSFEHYYADTQAISCSALGCTKLCGDRTLFVLMNGKLPYPAPFVTFAATCSPACNEAFEKQVYARMPCTRCFDVINPTHPCTTCWTVYYCSRECMKQYCGSTMREDCKALAEGRERMRRACEVCSKRGCTMRCSKCKSEYYCSNECQRVGWGIHKKYCVPTTD
jgi:hypothetical protein